MSHARMQLNASVFVSGFRCDKTTTMVYQDTLRLRTIRKRRRPRVPIVTGCPSSCALPGGGKMPSGRKTKAKSKKKAQRKAAAAAAAADVAAATRVSLLVNVYAPRHGTLSFGSARCVCQDSLRSVHGLPSVKGLCLCLTLLAFARVRLCASACVSGCSWLNHKPLGLEPIDAADPPVPSPR